MKRLTFAEKIIGALTILYTAFFVVIFTRTFNYEFFAYVGVLIALFFLIASTIRKTQFSPLILSGLSVWGLLHLAGGGLRIDGATLYSQQLVHIIGSGEGFILKYDQLVHFFGFFVATFVIFHLLTLMMERAHRPGMYMIAALSSMGLGVVNELVEFSAFLLLAETGVGGFMNLSLDLVFNTLGAASAALVLYFWHKR